MIGIDENEIEGVRISDSAGQAVIPAAGAVSSQDTGNAVSKEACSLRTLYTGIWKADRRYEPLSMGVILDTWADANFISIARLNELGFVLGQSEQYTGNAFSTACGGWVKPLGKVKLRWHLLTNTSVDFEDEFLVINSTDVGAALGIETITQREILQKGLNFRKGALSPLDSGKLNLSIRAIAIPLIIFIDTEKQVKEQAESRRRADAAGQLERIRQQILSQRAQSSEWSAWSEWHPDQQNNRYYCYRQHQDGSLEYRFS
jgi:hypothetical protein